MYNFGMSWINGVPTTYRTFMALSVTARWVLGWGVGKGKATAVPVDGSGILHSLPGVVIRTEGEVGMGWGKDPNERGEQTINIIGDIHPFHAVTFRLY